MPTSSGIPAPAAIAGSPRRPGVGLRVRLEPSVERFVDLRLGPQEQRPSEQCGDLLVRDRDGNWTYQFAATVDDFVQGVTLVIRGDDLLASTGRQIQLARLLGRAEPPAFLHHPLIMKSPTQKLSKSDGDTGIRDLRARGWTPAQVIEHALVARRVNRGDGGRRVSRGACNGFPPAVSVRRIMRPMKITCLLPDCSSRRRSSRVGSGRSRGSRRLRAAASAEAAGRQDHRGGRRAGGADAPSRWRTAASTGVIGTEIKFSLLLPDDWNHKFLMGGGGGFVGSDRQPGAASSSTPATRRSAPTPAIRAASPTRAGR